MKFDEFLKLCDLFGGANQGVVGDGVIHAEDQS